MSGQTVVFHQGGEPVGGDIPGQRLGSLAPGGHGSCQHKAKNRDSGEPLHDPSRQERVDHGEMPWIDALPASKTRTPRGSGQVA